MNLFNKIQNKVIKLLLLVGLGSISSLALGQTSVIWTPVHGADGQIELFSDGTYTSTCTPHTGYTYARCPEATGRYARGTGGNAQYFYFYGSGGTTRTYRLSGSATSPDTMTQMDRNSSYYRGIILKKSETFVCSEFYDSTYAFSKGPIGVTCGSNLCLTGSNQFLGVISSSNYKTVAEISPNFFVNGKCN